MTIKGLSVEIIELARTQAKEKGMTLHSWFEAAILEAAKTQEQRRKEAFALIARAQVEYYRALRAEGFAEEAALQIASKTEGLGLYIFADEYRNAVKELILSK